MRIGFDAKRLFHNNTGLGNYSRTLVRNLYEVAPQHDYFLYTPSVVKNESTAYFLVENRFTIRVAPSYFPFWRQTGMARQIHADKIDIFHGLSHEIPFLGKIPDDTKTIVTIHDLIFEKYPQLFPWLDRKMYQWKYRQSARTADHIVAISKSTKQDIVDYWHIASDEISIVYQSCNPMFFSSPGLSEKRKHFLYVGAIIERKGLHDIIKAFAKIDKVVRIPLIVIGEGGAYASHAKQLAANLGVAAEVKFLGNVANEELISYYDQAQAIIYPSRYEGFGIPIVEAALRGTPVICSDVSSMPEAAGNHAIFVNPGDVEAIYSAMESLILNEEIYSEMIEKAYLYAKEVYSAEETAYSLLNVYEIMMRNH